MIIYNRKKAVRNRRNFKWKIKNGITLIILIVTIIVLLILAGVTIVAITSDNDIIDRTVEVKEQNNNVLEQDKTKMNEVGNSITSK